MNATLRFQILRRDAFTCRYCGAKAPNVELHVDHVTPVALGGRDEPENLVTSCADCNGGKASTPPDAAIVNDVAATAAESQAALRLAAEEMRNQFAEDDARFHSFMHEWNESIPWCKIDESERASVLGVLNCGLPEEEIRDAFHVAIGAPMYVEADQVWRYFHGVINRKVDRMHEIARRIREESE